MNILLLIVKFYLQNLQVFVSSPGKMGALAVLLQKLKARGHRVLILTQMSAVLDLLELFLDFHFLPYIRISERGADSQHNLVRAPLTPANSA